MNTVPGIVQSILEDDLFVRIDIAHSGDLFSACILHSDNEVPYSKIGTAVNMIFKEADTIISLKNNEIISCRNRFLSNVVSVVYGKILARVTAVYQGITIISLVTTESALRINLQANHEIVCMVKSTSMMLSSVEQVTNV